MSHIFISYSRKDMDFAQKIVDALADNDLDTWIDWKSIPKGEDWEQEIYRGIEEADAFLFLLSPDSVASKMCNKEIAHAVKNGKRILPIVIWNADVGDFLFENTREEISKRNWIFCREGQDDFEKAIVETRETVHTDYEWLKYHTRLQVKALDWDRRKDKKDKSLLLRGKELQKAEEQLTEGGSKKDPQPTDLQLQHILASRRSEKRQKRRLAIGLSLGLVIMIILFVIARIQRNEAQIQANISRSRELVTLALTHIDTELDLAYLFSIEALLIIDNDQTYKTLVSLLQLSPNLRCFRPGINPAISPDGETLASVTKDNSIIFWNLSDLTNPIQIGKVSGHLDAIKNVVFSPDGKTIASQSINTIMLWDISDLSNPTQKSILTEIVDDNLSHNLSDLASASGIAISPNGKYMAVRSTHGKFWPVSIWDVSNLDSPIYLSQFVPWEIWRIAAETYTYGLAFNFDSEFIAINASSGITFWNINDPSTPELWGELFDCCYHIVTSMAFSPAGEPYEDGLFVVGTEGGTIEIWNLGYAGYRYDFWKYPEISQQSKRVSALAFSQDGNILVSGSNDAIVLWDISYSYDDDGIPPNWIGTTGGHVQVNHIIFRPDNAIIVVGSTNSSTVLWEISTSLPLGKTQTIDENSVPQSLVEIACQTVGRNFTQTEWQQYFPGEEYRVTCPQWPAGE